MAVPDEVAELHDKDGLSIIAFASAGTWWGWLEQHHTEEPGLWLRIAKKASGIRSVNYSDALDVALCYGWIDGQKDRYDNEFFLQRFTPRRPRSRWARVNRDRVDRLIADGRMRPAGLAQVEAARADGRWEAAYSSQSQVTVPAELQRELDSDPASAEFLAGLTSAQRYWFLHWIDEAKRPETRARRVARTMELLRNREKLR